MRDTWGYTVRRLARDWFYGLSVPALLWVDEKLARLHGWWKS